MTSTLTRGGEGGTGPDRRLRPVLLLSSDGHAGATAAVYREFLEPQYLEEFDRWVEDCEATAAGMGLRDLGDARTEIEEHNARRRDRLTTFGTDLHRRVEMLEAEGIVAEVLYPRPLSGPTVGEYGLPFMPFRRPGEMRADADPGLELAAAGHRAHNRWQAATLDPSRQVGLAILSLHDVEAATAEARWAARSGLGGVLLVDGAHPDLAPLDDPSYDPVWAACAEGALPVHFHSGAGLAAAKRLGPVGTSSVGVLTPYDLYYLGRRPLGFLTLGGVCARHPELRIVFTEMGAAWAPDMMRGLDWLWKHKYSGDRERCPEKPSFYYERQAYIGFSMASIPNVQRRYDIGVDKLMWGGDHPHTGGSWDITDAWLRATFGAESVPEDEARAIFGETMAHVYNLDRKKLEAVAERVGPSIDDLLRPPSADDLAHPSLQMMIDWSL